MDQGRGIRASCQVPAMGIALMVMVPMLYTDVSDAWRLKDRRKRRVLRRLKRCPLRFRRVRRQLPKRRLRPRR